ncbi:MAG: hypothetical protein DMF63_07770 [Acidobacteria bacterium]|nr:MAG: hypothetical protein DMF63_07770 [Acidobacteriota bacterium]
MIYLEKAIRSLTDNKVDFVIVGGVAINLHSSGYITSDLDICYSRSKENIRRLTAALAPFEPWPRGLSRELPFFFDESALRNGTKFNFETSIGDIDLLGEVKGLGDFSSLVDRTVIYEIYDSEVKLWISPV